MQKLRIAYFGSPQSSADFLEKMIVDKELPIEVKLVVTQPDKKVGREQTIASTPVKQIALKYGIAVADDLNTLSLKDIDLTLALFFGKIISSRLLSQPQYGFWTLHFSDLPKYRGGFPFVYSLIMNDPSLKVSLFKLDEKLDHGPIIDQEEIIIQEKERAPQLEKRACTVGYELFKKNLPHLIDNSVNYQKQDETKATYTQLLKRDHGFIPLDVLQKALKHEPLSETEIPVLLREYFKRNNLESSILNPESSNIIFNYFRGLYPWPGIWTKILVNGQEKRLKITDMDYKDGTLILNSVQLEGKTEVPFSQFAANYLLQ